ncbi:MAG TPA: tail fiber domain-containing protein [Candidatus Handelsmanbacteria bacterium]|nr:tail fiber domain-containing protein [Candidatus Handelsmanbacteria bacterium]
MASGGSSSSKQSSKPWIEQQPFLKEIYGLAQGLHGQGPYEYGPDRVAGFDPASSQGQYQAEQRAMKGSPLLRDAQGEMRKTLSGEYLSPESNPWLSGMYDAGARGMTRNFQQTVMPTLNSRFAMGRTQQDAGQNAQTAAMGRAQGQLATGLGDLAQNLYGGAYSGERNRMGQMAQMAPAMAATDYADSSMLRGIGQERQGQAQRYLDELVNRFDFQQHAPAQRLAEYSGFIGAPVQTSRGSSSSFNMGILSSDIRLKENIERTGETASGIPIYRFDYKIGQGPTGRYEGVMAQDLLELQPDAVAEMANGYLGVDYSRIDADFRRVGEIHG